VLCCSQAYGIQLDNEGGGQIKKIGQFSIICVFFCGGLVAYLWIGGLALSLS